MSSFLPTDRSRLRRLHERGHHDRATLHAVLDAGVLCHVGYVIDGQPYVTPTAYWRLDDTVWWHGSSASRMLRTVRGGVPVCLTVTHLDGFVLARSGFHHSMNYRSAMLFGRAEAVTDGREKQAALRAFIERMWPGRAATLRADDAQELKATMVLRMAIEEASAKIRTGPPKDDEPDYGLPIWAGVIPVRQVVGEVEPDPRLAPEIARPAHVSSYLRGAPLDRALAERAR
jgi:hypothetical protein